MKKRKLTTLNLKKQVVSSLNQNSVNGGVDQKFTVTCAIPVGNCTIALTVQPHVCQTLPRPLGNCTVQLSVQVWCNQTFDAKC
ncbi:hypothetical protein IMCC3317_47290 [Kordia antarctica]|uniref:Uncharacterized protein n=1 Tax=Kordia antarctica TaxID=1218801 RepID=A0A7L4ZSF8_9FLAO|nr:hypothetical protein [Kordia antarctica]QHI39319.1 hypothetical protein IMCC3317_47290 [Kordia antarctica]